MNLSEVTASNTTNYYITVKFHIPMTSVFFKALPSFVFGEAAVYKTKT